MNDPSVASGAVGADLPFRSIAALIREHARAVPRHPALVDSASTLDYGSLDALMDRVAASLQRDGVAAGDSIAICAVNSTRYAAIFLGALRAGVVVAPLAASVTPASFRSMLADAGARLLFVDASADAVLGGDDAGLPRRISLDGKASGTAFDAWLAAAGQCAAAPSRSAPGWRSTSSIRRERPARRRASSSRTACAGRTSCAAAASATRARR